MPRASHAAAESPAGVVAAPHPRPRLLATATTSENRALGQLLKRFRLSYGLNQSTMAAHLGLTPKALSRLESGQQIVPAAVFVRMADAFGVPIEYVWHGGQIQTALTDWLHLGERLTPAQRAAFVLALDAVLHPAPPAPLPLTSGAHPGASDDCGCVPPRHH